MTSSDQTTENKKILELAEQSSGLVKPGQDWPEHSTTFDRTAKGVGEMGRVAAAAILEQQADWDSFTFKRTLIRFGDRAVPPIQSNYEQMDFVGAGLRVYMEHRYAQEAKEGHP